MMPETQWPLVVAYGGGRNGTGMLIGMQERGIKPDLILFADTGNRDTEKPATYLHIDAFSAWLVDHGMPNVTYVRKTSKYASLYDECWEKKTLPSLAFGWRSCSDKWKQEPQRKLLNHWDMSLAVWAAGGKVLRAVGFHAGEEHRAQKFVEDEKYRNWYPLIEWGWDNEACLAAITRIGMAIPPKSACYFCPASRKPEVIELRDTDPVNYAKAVAMERRAAQTLTTIKGLGRHWSWENVAGAPETTHTVDVPCMCFDE